MFCVRFLVIFAFSVLSPCVLLAGVTTSGDVVPTSEPLTWDYGTEAYIGYHTAGGTMTINSGSIVQCFESYIGYESGISGEVTVDGANSTWDHYHSVYVGKNGDGILNITNGGTVNNVSVSIANMPGSTGLVNVDGANSTWNNTTYVYVCGKGNGTLNILNGGTVNDKAGWIGHWEDSVGKVTIDGTDSTWTHTEEFYVGGAGSATLDIKNAGSVSNTIGYVAYYPGSSANITVDGPNSTWTNSEEFYVGHEGSGTLHITNGGSVSNTTGYIGYESGSSAEVTVDGTGSVWNNSSRLYVGYEGSGALNITNGGKVGADVVAIGSPYCVTSGEVTVDGPGAILDSQRGLCVWSNNDGYGRLSITNGGLVCVNGSVEIKGSENHDAFINMATGGMLALWGEADESLEVFFDLIDGDDTIQWWNNLIGTEGDWAPLTTAAYGHEYRLDYITDGDLAGYTVLTVGEGHIPGDANKDNIVDGSDATILANHWQYGVSGEADATWSMGDFNGDGAVDGSDATILATYWQTIATTTAVPEPSAVALFLLMVGMGLVLKKRRV